MSEKIIKMDNTLRDAQGNPLNPADRQAVPDMSAAAIEKRENIQTTKEQMQKAMDDYVMGMNPAMVGHKPQLLSEAIALHNIIICKPHMFNETTKGGIILEAAPDSNKVPINDAIGYVAVKCGPEVVNVRPGDRIFEGSAKRPMVYPLIDDINGDHEVREYHCFAENWIVFVLREGGSQEDAKPSAMPDSEIKSEG